MKKKHVSPFGGKAQGGKNTKKKEEELAMEEERNTGSSNERKNTKRTRGENAEPLEELASAIVQELAANGHMELKDLLNALNINSRRAYELLNVLSAVPNERPMLQRVKGPKHTELVFLNGEPLHLPNIALLLNSLERELHELHELLGYVAAVPQRERCSPKMKKALNDLQREELAKTKEE